MTTYMQWTSSNYRRYHREESYWMLASSHPIRICPQQHQCQLFFNVGESLTPSPVTATMAPIRWQPSTMINFCCGDVRANTISEINGEWNNSQTFVQHNYLVYIRHVNKRHCRWLPYQNTSRQCDRASTSTAQHKAAAGGWSNDQLAQGYSGYAQLLLRHFVPSGLRREDIWSEIFSKALLSFKGSDVYRSNHCG